MPNEKFDLFVSHNSKDKDTIDAIAKRLSDEYDIHPWLDKWSLVAATDWAPAIEKALQNCGACAVVLGENGWGPHHLGEAQLALKRKREFPDFRVIPILLPGASAENMRVVGDFFQQVHRVEFKAGANEGEAFQRLWAAVRGEAPGPPLISAYKIERDAKYWQRLPLKNKKSALYAGEKLLDAQEIAGLEGTNVSEVVRNFLRASVEDEQSRIREGQRRTRKIMAGLAIGLILVAALAVVANVQRSQANGERERAVAAALGEKEARKEAESEKENAQRAAKSEREARENEQKQREEAEKQTELATQQRQEAVKQQRRAEEQTLIAEDRRREAERQTQLAFSRELAANALLQTPLDSSLGLLLSKKAVEITPTPTNEAQDALRTSMASLANLHAVLRLKYADTFHPLLAIFNPLPVVTDVTFSPDGTRILVASGDGVATLWDVETKRKIGELAGHKAIDRDTVVYSARFSPNGKRILTTSNDSTVRLWTKEGKELAIIPVRTGVTKLATFSPDSQFIIVVGDNQTILLGTENVEGTSLTPEVWSAITGAHITSLPGHKASVEAVEFSSDGRHIAVMNSYRGSALVWRTDDWKLVAAFSDLEGKDFLDFSPDGRFLVVLKGDKSPAVYDTQGWQEIKTLEAHEGAIQSSAFSPDGKYILTWGETETARLWETGMWVERASLQGLKGRDDTLSFSPNSKFVIDADEFESISLWEVDTGRHALSLDARSPFVFSTDGKLMATFDEHAVRLWTTEGWQNTATLRGHQLPPSQVAFSPDAKYIVTASMDGTAQLWKTEGNTGVVELRGNSDRMFQGAFSPDGRLILGQGVNESVIYVWNAQTNRRLNTLKFKYPSGYTPSFKSAAFTIDSRQIVAVDELGTRHIWDAQSGERIDSMETFVPSDTSTVVFSPDAKYIASSTRQGENVLITEVSSKRVVAELPQAMNYDSELTFSPNGSELLISSKSDVQVWDILAKKILRALPGHGQGATHMAYSHDGQLISTVAGRTLRIWDANTAQNLRTILLSKAQFKDNARSPEDLGERIFLGYKDFIVSSVAFSPDKELIVITMGDKISQVWNWQVGRQVATLRGHQAEVLDATFSPDGKRILTTSMDGTARVYPWEMFAPLEQLLTLMPTKVAREMTPAEIDQYLHIRRKIFR